MGHTPAERNLPLVSAAGIEPVDSANDSDISEDSLQDFYVEKGPVKHTNRTRSNQCPICHLDAKTALQLSMHLRAFHADSHCYNCTQCDHALLTVQDLDAHVRNVYAAACFECTKCSFSVHSKTKIRKHARTHSMRKFHCVHCDTKLSSHDVLCEHQKRHADFRVYPCVSCGKEFSFNLACCISEGNVGRAFGARDVTRGLIARFRNVGIRRNAW